jgi:very-short-patch-repair endonuclease
MHEVPDALLTGVFTRRQALEAGASKTMLAGSRFVRVHPRVWRHRDYRMTWLDDVTAARLALPSEAHLTHISRIQLLGLGFGSRQPLHFVIEGELHLVLDGIFLHRTKQLAPYDNSGVVPSAAFIAYCSSARLMDAIVVGDWLLHQRHTTTSDITTLALAAPWRDGADEALFVLDHLDRRSRSVKESETRAILAASGLPAPQLNHRISLGDDATAFGDLVYVEQGLVVEFEGGHHQEDRDQYVRDIERFALFRGHGVPYLQVTRETLDRPKTLVGTVYRTLVSLGYDGPAPEFGDRWNSLFRPVRELLPPRRTRLRELAAGR